MPLDENWWIKEKLKREQVNALPPTLAVRLEIEKTLDALPSMTSEYRVRKRLETLNEGIRAAHDSHIAGPTDGVRPMDVEAVVAEWKSPRAGGGESV